MKLTSALLISASALLATGAANAADLGRGGMKDDPIVVSSDKPINWTSIYIGIDGGYMDANHEIDVPLSYKEESVNLFNLDGLNSRGFIGGVTAGLDKQLGSDWVIGIQAFYHFSNADTNISVFGGEFSASIDKDEEYGAVVRLGRLLGTDHKTLAYVLGGVDWAKYSLHSNADLSSVDGLKTSNTFFGPIAGVGVEHAFTNYFSVGGEYTHVFGGKEDWFRQSGEGETIAVTDRLNEDRFMINAKLRFGPGLFGY